MKKEADVSDKDNWISLIFTNIFGAMKDFFLQGVIGRVEQEMDLFVNKFRSALEESQKSFLQDFTLRFISVSGALFVFIGLVFGLVDIVGVPRTYAFLLTGIVVLIVAFFIRKYLDIKNRLEAKNGSEKKS